MRNESPIFITYLDPEYSRTGVVYKWLKKNVSSTRFAQISIENNPIKIIREICRIGNRDSVYIVMSPAHLLCIYLWISGRRNIVLDAGWPLSDATLGNKKCSKKFIIKLKNWIIDYLSFQFSKIVILESESQKKFTMRKFKFVKNKSKKFRVNLTGFNESDITNLSIQKPYELKEFKNIEKERFILFRGKYTEESGFENIIKLMKEFTKREFHVVIVTNKSFDTELQNDKMHLINRRISNSELKYIYTYAGITIGQLSNNSRLHKTIPHKYFESGYFGKPYITFRHHVLETELKDNNIFYLNNVGCNDFIEIVNKCMEILEDTNDYDKLKHDIRNHYRKSYSQEIIAKKFQMIVQSLTLD